MSYVMVIITSFTGSDAEEVTLKARGRSITTAVDAAEITRRRFMKELNICEITIGTEEIQQEGGPIQICGKGERTTKGERKIKPRTGLFTRHIARYRKNVLYVGFGRSVFALRSS